MIGKAVSCLIALALVTLVHADTHEKLLASGYEYIPDVGYYAFGTGKNWSYAQEDCMSSKGRLAVINSEVERQAIVSFLSKHTDDTYVYGGYTNFHEVQYVTTDGIPFKQSAYAKWETGKPSSTARRSGGINTKTGELADFDYNTAMSYICERQLWTNYTYVDGIGYYKLHTEGKGWADAYDICESEGAHLLVIDSQAEADAVMEIFNQHPHLPNAEYDGFVYIGFRAVFQDLISEGSEGTYLTIFGTSVTNGYVKWIIGEPTVYNYLYCGTLRRPEVGYYMLSCDVPLAFFCERGI